MITGWIQVEIAIEVAVYGFIRNRSAWIGGVMGMLGKWIVQHIIAKVQKFFHRKD